MEKGYIKELTELKSCCHHRLNSSECCVEEIGEVVQKLVRVLQVFEEKRIKAKGFTSSRCYALMTILEKEKITMNDLSERIGLNTSTMTRIINNLVRDGYVERDSDQQDRRIVIVKLTESGKEAARELKEDINDFYKKIIGNIPEGNVMKVLSSVSILLNAFDQAYLEME
ncbi:MarR family winged helix-turn-helix transcriptional regulator [Alkaliphilus transvaalensis]|uniref:MarR family winged helix-turn-helix transcriptional regulator n=1 Tax=Alkaliphilus transvaalensis TaxID=114628 RepID=UPI000686738E|nr:MarR family transcriptional regulator [Alkaliphilus transvaalensis]